MRIYPIEKEVNNTYTLHACLMEENNSWAERWFITRHSRITVWNTGGPRYKFDLKPKDA